MNKLWLAAPAALLLIANDGSCSKETNPAGKRQAQATVTAMDAADREIGMPRIANYAQRKLLKNAYEDMDQTTLTYVYTLAMDGLYVCLGQSLGYGVSLGTQFTAPTYPQVVDPGDGFTRGVYEQAQPEPNGLYMPESGAATIVNLIDPNTGIARTTLMEPDVITTPNKLHAAAVKVECPGDVDPASVRDAKETSAVKQRD